MTNINQVTLYNINQNYLPKQSQQQLSHLNPQHKYQKMFNFQQNQNPVNISTLKTHIDEKIEKILELLYQNQILTKNRKIQTQPDQFLKYNQQLTKNTNESQQPSKKRQIILDDLFTTLIPPLQISTSKSICSIFTSRPSVQISKKHKGSFSEHNTSQLSYDNFKQRHFNKLIHQFNQALKTKPHHQHQHQHQYKQKQKQKQKIERKQHCKIIQKITLEKTINQIENNVQKHRKQNHQNYIARDQLIKKILLFRKGIN